MSRANLAEGTLFFCLMGSNQLTGAPPPPGLAPCAPHACAGEARGRERLGTGAGRLLTTWSSHPGTRRQQGTAPGPDPHREPVLPDVSPSSSWEDLGSKPSSLLGDSTPPGLGPQDLPVARPHGRPDASCLTHGGSTQSPHPPNPESSGWRAALLGPQPAVPCRGHLLWTHRAASTPDLHVPFPTHHVTGREVWGLRARVEHALPGSVHSRHVRMAQPVMGNLKGRAGCPRDELPVSS